MMEADILSRAESFIQREGGPVGLLELRKNLGLPASRASELTKRLRSDPRFYRVGSKWFIRKGQLKIKVRFCPNCSSKKVKLEGGFFRCQNCEIKFHFTWLL